MVTLTILQWRGQSDYFRVGFELNILVSGTIFSQEFSGKRESSVSAEEKASLDRGNDEKQKSFCLA